MTITSMGPLPASSRSPSCPGSALSIGGLIALEAATVRWGRGQGRSAVVGQKIQPDIEEARESGSVDHRAAEYPGQHPDELRHADGFAKQPRSSRL